MSLALDQINLGTAPAGKDGDTQRTANAKTNANMTAIQAAVNGKVDAAGGAFTARPIFAGKTPWDSGNLPSPAQTTGADFTGPVTFSQRPTFAAKTPWDSGNLPSPAQTTGADFTGDISYAARLVATGAAANQITAILARGQDQNFQLWVANGSAGGTGTMVSRLVNVYSGSGENASIDFVRGSSATNGWISFKQGGTEKATLTVNGIETQNAYLSTHQATTASAYAAVFYNGNGAVGSITTAGSVTSFNTSSDYRLKGSYAPISAALESINRMRFYSGEFKSTPGSKLDYVIAHELQIEAPFAVTGEKDAEIHYPVFVDGYDMWDVRPEDVLEVITEIDPQRVDYSKLVPRMGAAIQELSAQLEGALSRIAVLEGRA